MEICTSDDKPKDMGVESEGEDTETLAIIHRESIRKRTTELDALKGLGSVSRKLDEVEDLEEQNKMWMSSSSSSKECKDASSELGGISLPTSEDTHQQGERKSIADLMVGRDRIQSDVQEQRHSQSDAVVPNLFAHWLTPKTSEPPKQSSTRRSRAQTGTREFNELAASGELEASRTRTSTRHQNEEETRRDAIISALEAKVGKKLEQQDAQMEESQNELEELKKSLAHVKELAARQHDLKVQSDNLADKSKRLRKRVLKPQRSFGLSTLITHHRQTLAHIAEDLATEAVDVA